MALHNIREYTFKFNMGRYLELNKELTVPHTVVLPIELYLPFIL